MHPQDRNYHISNQGDAVHCCEFCLTDYEARPQVKNPRACQKPECQCARQRANEREWRVRHPGLYETQYHAVQRQKRIRQIQSIALIFQKCFQMGASLSGVRVGMVEFSKIFEGFLLGLGVRQINKFWKVEDGRNFQALGVF